jgi:hypothetical protein
VNHLPLGFKFSECCAKIAIYSWIVVGKDFFEEEPEPEEDPAVAAAAAAAQAAQAEKRKLRKAASAAAADAPSTIQTGDEPALTESAGKLASTPQVQEKPAAKPSHVRGKSGQRKKMKEKYRDQGTGQAFFCHPPSLKFDALLCADDDERELALEVKSNILRKRYSKLIFIQGSRISRRI